jgi:hypothetical protein
MKIQYKNSLYVALSTLLCLFLALPSQAQRGATGGGGGGSSSGGGGGSSSGGSSGGGGARPSYSPPPSPSPSYNNGNSNNNNSSSYSRQATGNGNVGISRPGYSIAPPQNNGQSSVRGNYGFAPRQGSSGVGVRGNYGFAPRDGSGVGGVRGNYGYAPRQGSTINGFAPRQSAGITGVTPRGATSGGLTYRTAPQIGYNGYWGNHNYYHYYQGYYSSYYLPSLGFSCAYLPFGYYPFYWGDDQYFFSQGLFYQYNNNNYTVVEPPIGAEVKTLPEKAQSIVINGQQYYELNGVYYQPVTKDDGTVVYQVAGKDGELNTGSNIQDAPQGPQMGDIVLELPLECRKIKVNGQKLWVSPEGVYYQELTDSKNNKTYKVVGLPSDEQEQN